jgi:hypothetical protein
MVFYLFIFSVTIKRILECGMSLDPERLSLSKSEWKMYQAVWRESLLSSDLELLKKKTLIYVVLIVFLKWFIPVFVLFKSSHK